jgi:hypothetical protein
MKIDSIHSSGGAKLGRELQWLRDWRGWSLLPWALGRVWGVHGSPISAGLNRELVRENRRPAASIAGSNPRESASPVGVRARPARLR